jgi:hypothetical protein
MRKILVCIQLNRHPHKGDYLKSNFNINLAKGDYTRKGVRTAFMQVRFLPLRYSYTQSLRKAPKGN